MDTIKFVIEQYVDEEAGYRFPVVNIYINDQDLIDLVTRVEQKKWDGNKNTRSSYIGFEVDQFHHFHDEMMEKKRRSFSVLLTFTCTYAECNCIMANMVFDTHTIAWNDMKSPLLSGKTPSPWIDEAEAQELDWHPLVYTGLGPFVFDREQYLSALDKVTQESHLMK
jgi:hypothetical protein